jgi:phycobilisome rod-core linker protein
VYFMALPLLSYPVPTQNHRVRTWDISGDETPKIYSTSNQLSPSEMHDLIQAAYRQIFHEQQMLSFTKQPFLESQLFNGQITVRDFVRGLLLSDSFRRLNYEANNNYRFVEICVQRILGRNVYGDREKYAWSVILMTQGVAHFVDRLLNSPEYLAEFGDDVVPYQQSRILPQRRQGELPFARTPRYELSGKRRRERSGNLYAGLQSPPVFDGKTIFSLALTTILVIALIIVFSSAGSLYP